MTTAAPSRIDQEDDEQLFNDVGPPPKRRGRPAAAPSNAAPAPTAEGDPKADPEDTSAWPSNAIELWPVLLNYVEGKGLGPSAVEIGVKRVALGVFKGEPVSQASIRGEDVAPRDGMSASQALEFYLIEGRHAIGGDSKNPDSAGSGPAKYTLTFRWKSGGTIKVGHHDLASYQELKMARKRDEQIEEQAGSVAAGNIAAPLPPLASPRGQAPAAQPAAPAAAAAAAAPTAAPTGPSVDVIVDYERRLAKAEADLKLAEMRAEMAASNAKMEAMMASMRAEMQRPAPSPVVSEEEREARMTSAVVKQLQALGLVGAAGAPTTPTAALDPGAELLAAATRELADRQAKDKARETVRKAYGFQDPSTEIVQKEEPEEEEDGVKSLFKNAAKFVGSIVKENPGGVLAAVAVPFKGSMVGDMLDSASDAFNKAGAAAQAARAAHAQVPGPSPAWGKPPGV